MINGSYGYSPYGYFYTFDPYGVLNPGALNQPGQTAQPSTPAPTGSAAGASTPPAGASTFLKWTLAMVALWFVLTAMYEVGGTARELAPYLAGLILFGVLFTQGPQALSNLQGSI